MVGESPVSAAPVSGETAVILPVPTSVFVENVYPYTMQDRVVIEPYY